MYEDFEMDTRSESWTRTPQAEMEREAKMAKASKFVDDFFELGIDAGARTLSRAEKCEILGLAPTESLWRAARPAQAQQDALQPLIDFVKAEQQKIRSGATMTKTEVRGELRALAGVMTKIANGNL